MNVMDDNTAQQQRRRIYMCVQQENVPNWPIRLVIPDNVKTPRVRLDVMHAGGSYANVYFAREDEKKKGGR